MPLSISVRTAGYCVNGGEGGNYPRKQDVTITIKDMIHTICVCKASHILFDTEQSEGLSFVTGEYV